MAQSNRKIDYSSTLILLAIVIGLTGAGIFITSNLKYSSTPPTVNTLRNPTPYVSKSNPEDTSMKQSTFTFEHPTEVPLAPSICSTANLAFDDEGASNSKSNIFIALDPPNGTNVGTTGEIRAWVSDEAGGRFPKTGSLDSNGLVTSHSNPLVDKDSHGYPWEAALYLTLITPANQNGPYSGDKENGGSPKFPTSVKGKVTAEKSSGWFTVPVHDDPLPYRIGSRVGDGKNVAEYIWKTSSLGLSPGIYRAQVSVHDGDSHLAVECTTLVL